MDLTTLTMPILAGIVLEALGMTGAALAGVGASVSMHQALALETASCLGTPRAGHLARAAAGILLIALAAATTMNDAHGFGHWVTSHPTQ